MPIYAYQCESCGHAKDVLQKLSDTPLTDCPACGASTFKKQITAAGFQLKGSGWYVTDFRNNGGGATAGAGAASAASATTASATGAADSASSAPAESSKPAASAAPSTPCGGGCACH